MVDADNNTTTAWIDGRVSVDVPKDVEDVEGYIAAFVEEHSEFVEDVESVTVLSVEDSEQ